MINIFQHDVMNLLFKWSVRLSSKAFFGFSKQFDDFLPGLGLQNHRRFRQFEKDFAWKIVFRKKRQGVVSFANSYLGPWIGPD